MKKLLFPGLAAALIIVGALYSCSGGGGGAGISGSSGTTGTVGLYLTDDMSLYTQVTATIEKVKLVSSGTGTSCDLLGAPVSVNISNMAGIMQLVDVTQCPAGAYNRFRLEFDKSVQLLSGNTGTPTACSFTSYHKHGKGAKPNTLACDPVTGICSLDITGAVNVLANLDTAVALDFDLKNFDVANLGLPDCSVTMKVAPLTPKQMIGFQSVTGLVSNLSTTDMTFDLTTWHTRTFSVLYSGITDSVQPDLGGLLQKAQDELLRTQVTSSTIIDLSANTITASKIEVKVEGLVSGLTGTSFTLSYGPGGTKSMEVDYSTSQVSGTLADGAWVRVKLFGHDVNTDDFLADKVEVGVMGMKVEN